MTVGNPWTIRNGAGRVVATAIHDGHDLRPEVAEAIVLGDAERLREEDPFTGQAVLDVPAHIVVHRSRFEFDLNRGDDGAVYRTPDQCWGLQLWKPGAPDETIVQRSLDLHADYYRSLAGLLDGVAKKHERFALLDIHSYNHRRGGPGAEPEPQEAAPDINIGTFSMPREHWAFLIDPWMEALRGFDFNGRKLDVRENVAFQGRGNQTRFVHERYPERGCAIAVEFKKFFMDEWTGAPDPAELTAMRRFTAFMAEQADRLLG
jgi:hypothetical protein